MARKKSNDGVGALGVILFVALATLITFASAIYGVVALVAWNYYTRKSSRIPEAQSDEYFIATRAEARRIAILEKSLDDERRTLASVELEGYDLLHRSDGKYDERSTLGKRLNREIATSCASERGLIIELAEIKNYTHQRRVHFVGIKVDAASWRKAGVAYVTAVLCFSIYTPEWVARLNQFLNNSGWLGQIKFLPMLWGILAAAAFISLAIQQATRLYVRHLLEQKLEQGPKPDKHVAVRFAELLAAQSDIGLYESNDLDRAEATFEVIEGKRKTASGDVAVPSVSQPPANQNFKPEPPEVKLSGYAVTASIDELRTQVPPRMRRALWKRLATSVIFGLIGLISGVIAFGLSGQGDLGTTFVLIFPLIGLAWGFYFRKFSQLGYPS